MTSLRPDPTSQSWISRFRRFRCFLAGPPPPAASTASRTSLGTWHEFSWGAVNPAIEGARPREKMPSKGDADSAEVLEPGPGGGSSVDAEAVHASTI